MPIFYADEAICPHRQNIKQSTAETQLVLFMGGYLYILTNKNNTVLYTGVTENLVKRTQEHKDHKYKGFTQKFNVSKLVYYQFYGTIIEAIEREKIIKGGSREKKIALINGFNPDWRDLYFDISGFEE